MLVAMEGSVGYGIGGARVELEIGYERFKTKGIRDSGSKEDEADTVYLLAKELAYYVVTGQTDKLTAALAKTSGKDIVQFAKTLGISHDKISKKICKTKSVASGGNSYGKYTASTAETRTGDDSTSLCGDSGRTGSHSSGNGSEQHLGDFVTGTLKEDGSENWPTSTVTKGGKKEKAEKTNDNAEAVAKDLTKLTHDEKTIVAGLLAKTIEGGEVVEIRAVSSTSVMVNACYDLLSEGLGVVPYACVGLGGIKGA
ncbi:surface antigen family protein [Anaplasma phagocytophilum str. ApNP]|uniref:Surface antigen family protein n=1 Tax=Anaplasma phagocytophilum str. ApNP TaxID=1359153 RepID=A0A0F3NGM8_ANAPH|nr:surface antigen family protein [Anaplasma phagocytophilum str. ApNP]